MTTELICAAQLEHTNWNSHILFHIYPGPLCVPNANQKLAHQWEVMLPINFYWKVNFTQLDKDPKEFFSLHRNFEWIIPSLIFDLTSNLVPNAQPNMLRTAYDRDMWSNAQSSIHRGIYLKADLNTKVPPSTSDQVHRVPSGLFLSYTAVSTSAQSLLSFCYHQQQHYSTAIDTIDNKYWRFTGESQISMSNILVLEGAEISI